MNWYIGVLKKYAVFSGRSRRKEYWWFVLITVLITMVLSLIDNALGLMMNVESGFGVLSGIYSLAVLIPSLAVGVRRLHDTGRSGWWLLLGFIPVIGVIALIVLLAIDSVPGANEYGPNPKSEAQAN